MPRDAAHDSVPWTDAEDGELLRLQKKYGNKWSDISKDMGTRTGQQCAQRWRHRVNPNIRRERWTEEEDEKLRELQLQYGSKWATIAREMGGRTDQQCMGRWRRHLDPDVTRGAWDAAEDACLRALYDEYGPKWSLICQRVPGRTAQQSRARWFQLEGGTGEHRYVQRERKIKDQTYDEYEKLEERKMATLSPAPLEMGQPFRKILEDVDARSEIRHFGLSKGSTLASALERRHPRPATTAMDSVSLWRDVGETLAKRGTLASQVNRKRLRDSEEVRKRQPVVHERLEIPQVDRRLRTSTSVEEDKLSVLLGVALGGRRSSGGGDGSGSGAA